MFVWDAFSMNMTKNVTAFAVIIVQFHPFEMNNTETIILEQQGEVTPSLLAIRESQSWFWACDVEYMSIFLNRGILSVMEE